MGRPPALNSQRTESSQNSVIKLKSLIKHLDQEIVVLRSQRNVRNKKAVSTTDCFLKPPHFERENSTQKKTESKVKIERVERWKGRLNPVAANKTVSTSNALHKTQYSLKRFLNNCGAKVGDALKNRRIFTIKGNMPALRAALLSRGWIEKYPVAAASYNKRLKLIQLPEKDFDHLSAKERYKFESTLMSEHINCKNYPAFFIWQSPSSDDHDATNLPYRNRMKFNPDLYFARKIGLMACIAREHWFHSGVHTGMSAPRTFNLGNQAGCCEFLTDFRRTQCRNLVRFLIESIPAKILDDAEGSVLPTGVLSYALNGLERQLADESLDGENCKGFNYNEWLAFWKDSNALINGAAKLKSNVRQLKAFVRKARPYLRRIDKKRPDYKWDGYQNIWIIKPARGGCGAGIKLSNSISQTLALTLRNKPKTYLVQKYVERPLLIYNCKFDIRQYMLITIGHTTAFIWLYQDCYFKICSKNFTLNNLHPTIHVSNFTVQKRCDLQETCDPRLPKNHMWSLEQFKEYLLERKAPENTWRDKIFGGFKEILIAVVLATFEEMDLVENTFQLHGCDFMLDENYNPILLEINGNPDLSYSTDVTAKLCPEVVDDMVKVIVDLPQNKTASTGKFEKIHEVNYTCEKKPIGSFTINGKAMKLQQKVH